MSTNKQQKGQSFGRRRGVTLVEIAIVLVIIGLLLGGILKGQELINNAKIRNIANRQVSLKAAWFAFLAKYQALPGDYVLASQHIPGAAGPQNDVVEGITGDGILTAYESPIAFQNLTGAGYLRCPQCNAKATELPSASNSPVNNYGGVMGLFNSGGVPVFGLLPQHAFRGTGTSANPTLLSYSGSRVPSNIASEVDRKIDDGIANEGDVRFNNFATGNSPIAPSLSCMTSSGVMQVSPTERGSVDSLYWRHADAPVESNCGFSVNI